MNHLRVRTFSIALVGLWMVPLQASAFQNKPSSAAPEKTVSVSGCVKPGIEAGCLVVSDSKTKAFYNLLISGRKPAIGTAIHFTGTIHEGPTTCMQGTPVDVEKWNEIKMTCTAAYPK